MKSLLTMFNAPAYERIEEAVKRVALHAADAQYHRLMRDYFYAEKAKVTPSVSVENAYEYARLFQKQQDHAEEQATAERKHREAQAKLDALRTARPKLAKVADAIADNFS